MNCIKCGEDLDGVEFELNYFVYISGLCSQCFVDKILKQSNQKFVWKE